MGDSEDSVDHIKHENQHTPTRPVDNILDFSLPKGESLTSEMDQDHHLG